MRVEAERLFLGVGTFTEESAAEAEPAHENRQHRARCERRRAENQPELAQPDRLIDQGAEPGEKQQPGHSPVRARHYCSPHGRSRSSRRSASPIAVRSFGIGSGSSIHFVRCVVPAMSTVSAYSNRSQHGFSGRYDSRHWPGRAFARSASNRSRSVTFNEHCTTTASPPESLRLDPSHRPVIPPLVASSSVHGRSAGGFEVEVPHASTVKKSNRSHWGERNGAFSTL